MPEDLARAIAKVRDAAAHLPGIEEGSAYGDFALKAGGKIACAVKNPATLYIRVSLEEKELLLEAAPEIYYQTDHYKGWPGFLVRLNKIKKAELAARLERAWRLLAPKKLIQTYDGAPPARPKRKPPARKR